MNMNELAAVALPPNVASPSPATSTEVFQQLGAITRQLHGTLNQLGVVPQLHLTVKGLPNVRIRLNYIAEKTGAAAEKVLTSVDCAKADHTHVIEEKRRIATAIVADSVKTVASGTVLNFVSNDEATTARIEAHLTNIMTAQDFHDPTGQAVAKVVALADDLEDSLVNLLVQAAPPEPVYKVGFNLRGSAPNATGRTDVVPNQGDVDDLPASFGF